MPHQYFRDLEEGKTACVITSHNYGRYLAQCIESCLNQTHRFSDIIVVDDSSTDDTRDVTACYHHNGVRYLHGAWLNCSKARNMGYNWLGPRKPPFVQFMDADNWLEPKHLETILHPLLKNQELAGAYGLMRHMEEQEGGGTRSVGLSPYVVPYSTEHLLRQNMIDASAVLRSCAFEQAGMWMVDVSDMTDWALWLKLHRLGWQAELVPSLDCALNYRVHRNAMSSDRAKRHAADPLANSNYSAQTLLCGVVTLFSGKPDTIPRVIRALEMSGWPMRNLHLTALDNSGSEIFRAKLREALAGACAHTIVVEDSKAVQGVESADFSCSRELRMRNCHALAAHVGKLYATARQYVPGAADFVATLEDDIEPSENWIRWLWKGLQERGADMAYGLVPSRFIDGFLVLQTELGRAASQAPQDEWTPATRTGFGCNLWKRATFDAIKFRPIAGPELPGCAFDYAACEDLLARGGKILVCNKVRCAHINPDGHRFEIR